MKLSSKRLASTFERPAVVWHPQGHVVPRLGEFRRRLSWAATCSDYCSDTTEGFARFFGSRFAQVLQGSSKNVVLRALDAVAVTFSAADSSSFTRQGA
jgi:hypothetical protein